MSTVRLFSVLMLLLVLMSCCSVSAVPTYVPESQAIPALTSAEQTIVLAHQAVLDAKQAGANVSDLLIQLNDAAEQLGEAEVEYKLGDLVQATIFANASNGISEKVRADAHELQLRANETQYLSAWIKMITSILSVIFVGFGSLWSWRVFKRRFYKRLLRMKPEVV